MKRVQRFASLWGRSLRRLVFLLALVSALLLALPAALGQTLTLLHTFAGNGLDGSYPHAGLTMDRAGNLYGTAAGGEGVCEGGDPPCGTVFKLTHTGSDWIFSVLYTFQGGSDGYLPEAPVIFGPDGALYGTTSWGGNDECQFLNYHGCGTVFNLKPPVTTCKTALCSWTETVVYRFTGGSDGDSPYIGSLIFDRAGNVYGTDWDGTAGGGTVYQLSPSSGGWLPTVLYAFTDGKDGGTPYAGPTFDTTGNLWGTTLYGGIVGCENPQLPEPCGVLYELVRSGSAWTEKPLFLFNKSVGGQPVGELILDSSGNLYGIASTDGPSGEGVVFAFTPSTGTYNILFSFSSATGPPFAGLIMDGSGSLYGTTIHGGAYGHGTVFKLARSNGGWAYTDLHDFAGGSNDGANPAGRLVMDANHNLFGTTLNGGSSRQCYGGCGVVFEISP